MKITRYYKLSDEDFKKLYDELTEITPEEIPIKVKGFFGKERTEMWRHWLIYNTLDFSAVTLFDKEYEEEFIKVCSKYKLGELVIVG